MAVAQVGPARYRPHWKGGDALRTARICYDHLAGRAAVAITDTLIERGHVEFGEDGGVVTASGVEFLTCFGIDLKAVGKRKRSFCKPCLDWSERRPHLAGAVGAGLAERAFALGWFERVKDSRAFVITQSGERDLRNVFGVSLD